MMGRYSVLLVVVLALASGKSPASAQPAIAGIAGTPTCTYLNNYTISSVACGSDQKVIYFSDACDDTVVSFGEQSDAAKSTWGLSATSTDGVQAIPFTISSEGSRAACPLNRNLGVDAKGQAVLSGPSASFRVTSANASADCNTVYLQVVGGTKNGQYLSYNDCNSTTGFTVGTNQTATLWKLNPETEEPDFTLYPNHDYDNKVTKSYMANGVIFQSIPADPNTPQSQLTFDKGIVYIGTDETNAVISFICPQKTVPLAPYQIPGVSGFITIEVNIKQVGGVINPKSGAAGLRLVDMSWMAWGQFELPGMPAFNLTKSQAAQVEILDVDGGTDLFFENIAKNSTEDAFAVGVLGYIGKVYPNQSPEQQAVAKLVESLIPGLFTNGTRLQWNIYAHASTTPQGTEYVDFAASEEMGPHIDAHAPTGSVPAAAGAPTPASSTPTSAGQAIKSTVLGCVVFLASLIGVFA